MGYRVLHWIQGDTPSTSINPFAPCRPKYSVLVVPCRPLFLLLPCPSSASWFQPAQVLTFPDDPQIWGSSHVQRVEECSVFPHRSSPLVPISPHIGKLRHTKTRQNPSPGSRTCPSCRLFSAWTFTLHHPVAARSRFVSYLANPAPPAWCLGPPASHTRTGLARLIILAHCQTRAPSGFITSSLYRLATRRRQNIPHLWSSSIPLSGPGDFLWACVPLAFLRRLARIPFSTCSTHPFLPPRPSCCHIAFATVSISLSLHGCRFTQFGGQWSHLFLAPVTALSTPYWWRPLSWWLLQVPDTISSNQQLLEPPFGVISEYHCAGCLNVSEIKYHLEPSCQSLASTPALATAASPTMVIVISRLLHSHILFRDF